MEDFDVSNFKKNMSFKSNKKSIFILFIILISMASWQIYLKKSIFYMPKEYRLIKKLVNKIAYKNDLGVDNINFTIITGSHAAYLSKQLGICKEEDCYYIQNLNPFNNYENLKGFNLNEILNQSYLLNGLEAYAWSSGTIQISRSTFPFFGKRKDFIGCIISHELAHLKKEHVFKSKFEYHQELKSNKSNSSLSESDKLHIERKIDRNFETEADQISSKMMYLAGYRKELCLDALKNYGIREAFEFDTSPESTHPGYKERVKNLEEFIKNNLGDNKQVTQVKRKWKWKYDRKKNYLLFEYI